MQILKLDIIESGIRTLMAMLCQLIYPLISFLYNLFMNISKVNILSSEDVQPIYQRVTLILTIVMVFYITFEFVKFVVQPDGITDKEKGVSNIIYKMIAVVVLIAFVPTIFTWAFKLQTTIVDKGIIGKVIIGQSGEDTSKFGSNFAANIFAMFYSVPDEYKDEKCDDIECGTLVSMNLGTLANRGNLDYLTKGLNETIKEDTLVDGKQAEVPIIDFTFNGFLAVIVGGIIAYILALYCVDVGVRWAQMIYLQIIAPIPIIGYLSPKKDGIFQKWCKQCLTTYLDLFLRIAIIYFILLICSILMESRLSGELLAGIEADGLMETLIYVALILGVMLFAQKAPKMLSELFPKTGAASGNFGLKAGERVAPMAARTLGAAFGGTRALGGLIGRGYNTYRRNKAERDRTGETRKQQRERHKAEKKDFEEKRRAYNQNLRTRNRMNRRGQLTEKEKENKKEELENQRKELEKARSKVADNKNKRYRSVALNALAGAAGGAYRGITTGAQATKLEDIRKKVQEGAKKDRETIEAREKWLDSGGGSDLSRMASGIQKNIGIQTASDRTTAEIKRYEDEIKSEEETAKREEAAISTAKKSTDINEGKIESGKSKHEGTAEDATKIIKALGYESTNKESDKALLYSILSRYGYKNGEKFKLKDIFNLAKADADSKQIVAEEAAKKVQEAKTDAERAIAIANKEKAEAVAMLARNQVVNTQKTLGEMAVQQILSTPRIERRTNGNFDAEAITAVEQTIENIKISVSYKDTREELLRWVQKNIKPEEQQQYYDGITNADSIIDFDVYDKLSKALSSIAAERRVHTITQKQDTVNVLKTSSATDAAKANSSSGK